jgi:hypothetical protein
MVGVDSVHWALLYLYYWDQGQQCPEVADPDVRNRANMGF